MRELFDEIPLDFDLFRFFGYIYGANEYGDIYFILSNVEKIKLLNVEIYYSTPKMLARKKCVIIK